MDACHTLCLVESNRNFPQKPITISCPKRYKLVRLAGAISCITLNRLKIQEVVAHLRRTISTVIIASDRRPLTTEVGVS